MLTNVTNLLDDQNLRFIFVGGKGGVGKTTTSSALASQLAYTRKVLLISTDPAHSLSDAFRMEFNGTPQKVPGIANLEVMEVNPTKFLKDELNEWVDLAESAGVDELSGKIHDFQDWLSGIPGVDEATALSSVIDLVESGKYDTIVFDTAPTGHTLKLLQLPAIMQAGLAKLESWQSTLWSYWEVIKGAGQAMEVKKEVALRIKNYKNGIERIAYMLKDSKRTKFVVVCIAEFLSISETTRLLQELKRHSVSASNVIVNQLVTQTMSASDLAAVEKSLGQGPLLEKVKAIAGLAAARNAIQQKYLNQLKSSPESSGLSFSEIPLLPTEITGPAKLLEFSLHLLPPNYRSDTGPTLLKDRKETANQLYEQEPLGFIEGEQVVLCNLNKAPQYNGKLAQVLKVSPDGRVVIRVKDPLGEKFKILSLRPENLNRDKFLYISYIHLLYEKNMIPIFAIVRLARYDDIFRFSGVKWIKIM